MFEFENIKTASELIGFGDPTLRCAFCGVKGISWRVPGTNSWAWRLRDG